MSEADDDKGVSVGRRSQPSLARGVEAARVKALEWRYFPANLRYDGYEADSVAGVYSIPSVEGYHQLWLNDSEAHMGIFDTLDEAKAAAQAHFNAAILSSLEPAPARAVTAEALIEQINSVAKGRMDKLFTRDELGELVRKAWVAWALAQPEQKPHWLLPYAELSDADKLADIVIGQSVVSETVLRLLHRFVPSDGRTYLRAPARADAGTAATHRHKRRGTEYVLIGFGKMQATERRERGWNDVWQTDTFSQPVDMREVAIYRSVADGSLWVRPREEFEDGRFEPLPASPTDRD